jgi:hypothetical protein
MMPMDRYNARIANIPMPARIRRLPVTAEGWPELFFAAVVDEHGRKDLRVADERKKIRCLNADLCWLCGERLGRFRAFVIGPMCLVNRVTSEPPCHCECAEYAAKACPFLSQPRMRRNDKNLPSTAREAPGVSLPRNPGATCIYVTKRYRLMRVNGGVLVRLEADPESVQWWAEGQRASREQVMASIESGYPTLEAMARREGHRAVAELERCYTRAMKWLPA